ncbi:hypothetical protein F511_30500 [Dorcoceras hygrometricum]|uniref:Uncharacterized protein n=1 Tax=Dorcoceras hygrometricum TaxID=472368 RepID=A0A2Z7C8J0_9LAMI|nr:hypothetical protein F511_30500 [Dorcoceras hygrometricum]
MSLFDLQDVCIAIGSLATLDLPMVVDLIGIYVLKGPYCTLTMTNWFLQALSVIPRGSWRDVARRFTMILQTNKGIIIPVVNLIRRSTAAYLLRKPVKISQMEPSRQDNRNEFQRRRRRATTATTRGGGRELREGSYEGVVNTTCVTTNYSCWQSVKCSVLQLPPVCGPHGQPDQAAQLSSLTYENFPGGHPSQYCSHPCTLNSTGSSRILDDVATSVVVDRLASLILNM